MNPLASFSLPAQAFGWAVLQSTWQIALVWLVFSGLRMALNNRHQTVYRLSLAAMSASAAWFALTFTGRLAELTAEHSLAEPVQGMEPTSTVSALPLAETAATPWWELALSWLEGHTLLIGGAWGLCVALLWLRLLGGWWMVRRLSRRDLIQPAVGMQHLCDQWAEKLRITARVRLFESPHVREPLTIGFWKPIILFPAGMLLSLTPSQLEALLLHELAHIRRHDYLLNLLQMALETCFFYHPLFWLISREARARREFCCDDVVLRFTDDPLGYAKLLTNLQISFLHPTTQFTMNATGKSRFTERIWRIAGINPRRESRPNWMLLLLLPLLVSLGAWWPSKAASLSDTNLDTATTPVEISADTVAPKKVPAKKEQTDVPAEQPAKDLSDFADDLGEKFPNERIAVNIEPSTPENVAIQVTKMNVLYIGVDNPVRIAAAGIPNNELEVKLLGPGTIEGANGDYNVRVTQPGEATVRVMRRVGGEIKFVVDQKYRVKRIPDPVPRVDGKFRGGAITKETLLETNGVIALLENFDFDAICEVVSCELTLLGKEQDPITFNAVGGVIPPAAREMIKNFSGDGDAIFFDDVKVKCPGDTAPRNIGGIAFKLKPQGN